MCGSLGRWRDNQQRELPWLAGGAFSALQRVSVTPPTGAGVQMIERFLVGGERDAATVQDAVNRCLGAVGDPGPPLPPDARGALVDAVERFFDLLGDVYGELHPVVRDGHRRYVDQTLAQWQRRLDAAADDIEERALLLAGFHTPIPPPPKRPRGSRDHPGVALAFVVLALLGAGVMLYAVLHGWPMEPFDFAF